MTNGGLQDRRNEAEVKESRIKIKNALKFIDKRMKVLDELGKKTGSYGESGEWYHLERIKEELTNEES